MNIYSKDVRMVLLSLPSFLPSFSPSFPSMLPHPPLSPSSTLPLSVLFLPTHVYISAV